MITNYGSGTYPLMSATTASLNIIVFMVLRGTFLVVPHHCVACEAYVAGLYVRVIVNCFENTYYTSHAHMRKTKASNLDFARNTVEGA